MAKPRNRYSKAFKLEAVRLLNARERPVSELARELGVPKGMLYKWKRLFEERGDLQASDDRSRRPATEVETLKRRLAELEEENEILKKAAVYFAKEHK